MILPKPHLSFSQITMWLNAKESYRKQYYPKISPQFHSNVYMRYGNEVTEAMEKKETWVAFIPCYDTFELPLFVEINGILIKAFIDNIDMKTLRFREQKTTMTSWSENKINKHIQLDIYSLLLQEKYGKITEKCSLVWVETQKVEAKPVIMDGIELTGLGVEPTLSLTGKFKETERIITSEDRDEVRELIVRVAKEISEDYKAMGHLY